MQQHVCNRHHMQYVYPKCNMLMFLQLSTGSCVLGGGNVSMDATYEGPGFDSTTVHQQACWEDWPE